MTPTPEYAVRRRIDALVTLMERLLDLHVELGNALERKLDCMRNADLDRMRACMQNEQDLAARIGEQDGLRKQLMGQIGKGLGLSPESARELSMRALAKRLTEPHRQKINEVADRLKEALLETRRTNDLVGSVSLQTMGHIEQVFSAMTTSEESSGVYSRHGQQVAARPRELFEAVG